MKSTQETSAQTKNESSLCSTESGKKTIESSFSVGFEIGSKYHGNRKQKFWYVFRKRETLFWAPVSETKKQETLFFTPCFRNGDARFLSRCYANKETYTPLKFCYGNTFSPHWLETRNNSFSCFSPISDSVSIINTRLS